MMIFIRCIGCALGGVICARCGQVTYRQILNILLLVQGYKLDDPKVVKETKQGSTRVVGIPSDKLVGNELPSQALSGKHLGHVLSVMFWNDGQAKMLRALKSSKSGILLADYGCGKTSVLMAGANLAAEDPNFEVYFISVANWAALRVGSEEHDIIIDQALKVKFRGSRVRVITANELWEKVNNQ